MKIKVAYSHSNVSLITFKTQAGNRAWFFICGGISNARPRSLPLKKKKERERKWIKTTRKGPPHAHTINSTSLFVLTFPRLALALTVLPNTTFSKKPPLTNPRPSLSIPLPRLTYPFSTHCSPLTCHRFVCLPAPAGKAQKTVHKCLLPFLLHL